MNLFNDSTLVLNVIVISLFIFFVGLGYYKGFVKQVFNFVSLLVAFLVATFLYEAFGMLFKITPKFLVPFQDTILKDFFYTRINGYIWFVVLFIIAYIFIRFLSIIFNLIAKAPLISQVNKLLGAALGVLNFALSCVIMVFVISMPMFTNGPAMVDSSLLKPVVSLVDVLIPPLAEQLEQFNLIDLFTTLPKQASVEDVQAMQHYLEEQNVPMADIEQFLESIINE